MVGSGDKDFMEKIKPVLSSMGKNVFSCGKPGAGQVVKMCNNLILSLHMIATAEGFGLGIKSGIDPKLIADIIKTCTGNSWSLNTQNPVPGVIENAPSSQDYEGGFSSQLLLKDLNIAKESAELLGANFEFGNHSVETYSKIVEQGLGGKDFSVVFDANYKK